MEPARPAADLTPAQQLKFRLLAEGMSVTPAARARLDDLRGQRALTPADYPSTTGLILRLDDDVWVNAPIAEHNPEFVVEPPNLLDVGPRGFAISGGGRKSTASVWLPPLCHDATLSGGRPLTHFVFTHGDRARLSPIRGCAMRCKFCDLPFTDPYETKPVEAMIEALRWAFDDPLQPASHALISGGTPKKRDVPVLRAAYEQVLAAFPSRHIDIMMGPLDGLLDVPVLRQLGLHELSINIELVNRDIARRLIPQKHHEGLARFIESIAAAAAIMGPGRVRSMLMVGLEPPEDTLEGVRLIVEAGGVPVLSPFRPAAATPLKDTPLLSGAEYEAIFLAAESTATRHGGVLGPCCPPCTHNTLALVPIGVDYPYPVPEMV